MTSRQLPLHARHLALGARTGLFGEWEVPLYYTSILEEHEAVRTRAGLFDISHMGEFFVEGPGAQAFLEWALPRPLCGDRDSHVRSAAGAASFSHFDEVAAGRAVYAPLVNARGGVVDDIIAYRLGAARFLLIVNAGNVAKDFAHLQALKALYDQKGQAAFTLVNTSDQYGLLALQGPRSAEILARATSEDFSKLGYYRFCEWKQGLVSRTGYTGEDGFEIMLETALLDGLWTALLSAGSEFGIRPAGFGCRDTLRLEAGMPLYGHDLDDETAPQEAGIGWAVKMDGNDFYGREALLARQKAGWVKKRVGFETLDRGIPRQGQEIFKDGNRIGVVTSGSFSPTLKKNIGMGFVSCLDLAPDATVELQIRGAAVRAKICALPFYSRKK